MSQLKVNAISDAAGANGNAITLATDGTCTAKITNSLSNRNVLYNGAQEIYQRGSSTGVGASNGTVFATDRWGLYTQNTGSRYTISQDSDSPDGFAHSLKIDCTTADTSLASNEEVNLTQKIEGFDVQRFQKGTSGAKAYTLSFWVQSEKTGTYIVRLLGRDNTTSNVSKAYTVANTNWNKYTLNFPADTDSSRKDNSDNGEAFRIQFWLVAGSGVNSGTLQETWANSSDSGAATGQVNFADATNNFYITGVQLEVDNGSGVATDYEHRTYGDELARCQRYLFKIGGDNQGTNASIATGFLDGGANWSHWTHGGSFPVEMRVEPSLSLGGAANAAHINTTYTGLAKDASSISMNSTGARTFGFRVQGTSGSNHFDSKYAANSRLQNDDTWILFSAEL